MQINIIANLGACRNAGAFIMQRIRKEETPMAGRKPKPTAMKKLKGNPGEKNRIRKSQLQRRECLNVRHGFYLRLRKSRSD